MDGKRLAELIQGRVDAAFLEPLEGNLLVVGTFTRHVMSVRELALCREISLVHKCTHAPNPVRRALPRTCAAPAGAAN
jgi:hypothetical protein